MAVKILQKLFCILFVWLMSFSSSAQQQDTLNSYEYFDFNGNSWKIKMFDQDSVVFLAGNSKISYYVWLSGKFQSSENSTVRFNCDTSNSNSKGKEFIESDNNFSEAIKMIARGDKITKIGNYYIPCDDSLHKSFSWPLAKYISGNDEGNTIIEFQKHRRYTLHLNSCKLRVIEKGKWKLKNNLVYLKPLKKQKKLHRRITRNDQFFVLGDYLVAITFTQSMENSKLVTVKKFEFFKNYFTVFKQ